MTAHMLHEEMICALQWYADNGVEDILQDEVIDRTKAEEISVSAMLAEAGVAPSAQNPARGAPPPPQSMQQNLSAPPAFLGMSEARSEAVKLAKAANTLEELKKAIAEFEGIAIKKTATNMVFGDGHPNADIMLIGEAPGADEDRAGKPFAGSNGQLLDKILSCIDLARHHEDASKAVYLTNVLNWRPPGNRSPNEAEIAVSLPFLERHIQIVKPKILILCGGVAGKSLLNSDKSISRLRKTWHGYTTVTQEIAEQGNEISAIATYLPSDLLSTPIHKKSVWADMLELQKKIKLM